MYLEAGLNLTFGMPWMAAGLKMTFGMPWMAAGLIFNNIWHALDGGPSI